ncbi:PREDICTED: uncharacterized protein LOC107348808 [Acropora digitifera]|uniref:uncharacterized protein LOC107348808 n=1 Tax=Acropora digitifera TaxID=70779 RepID=UPI00077ACBE2|nr:PREDICTED: uncharacterized protein LOC107348808 [Acropora digitifera]
MASGDVDFSKYKVENLKKYLSDRGIQSSDRGKGKRRAELLELCQNAAEMKQQKLEEVVESFDRVLEEKLQTNEGLLPNPDTLRSWSRNFASIPEFTFADLYSYLVGKDDYSVENLRSFKSLHGYKLFHDGHVEDLQCCRLENKPFSYFQFKVKPAEQAKTEDGQSTYNGFFILKSSAEVHVAYCPCKGGSDGACKHVTAALFDLQSMVSSNLSNTCTSEECLWKRRNRNSDYAIRLEDLNIVKAEFGKEEKLHLKPYHFDPRSTLTNSSTLKEALRQGLKQVCPDAVALQFLPSSSGLDIPEASVAEFISCDANVEHYETVYPMYIYTMKEYADVFKSEKNIAKDFCCNDELVEETDKTNTIKLLMNYCPMKNVPEPLEWGHRKETSAAELYFKKLSHKHCDLLLKESGVVVNPLWPFLGASPDRVQYCKCHPKTLVEIKGLFSKRNLLPAVAAADKLIKTTNGYQLKVETTWYYQIQGQMAITGVKHTALVIYTNKGILIVPVEFDPVFWLTILKKLQLFFVGHLAPELLTGRVLKDVKN